VCGGPMLRAGRVPVCDACVDGVAAQSGSLCGRCGEALGIDLDLDEFEDKRFLGMLPEGILCAPCRRLPPDFVRAVAYGAYEDELREMVHLLKYERMRPLAEPLGAMLAQAIEMLEGDAAKELAVIAVPLYPARERQRGYNQSVLLADAAIARMRTARPEWKLVSAHRSMRRTRSTESQYVLSPRGRRANLRGAFEVADKASLKGREVLLVDDIFTSGATARECARVLVRAGAAKVWVATLARAQVARVKMQTESTRASVAFWEN
jgi:ComF family protein